MSTEPPPPPYPGSYWVIPGELAAGAYPISSSATAQQRDEVLNSILNAGIRSIINLMEEEEIRDHERGERFVPYEDTMEELAEAHGEMVEIQRHAIAENAPPQVQEIELILDALDNEIDGRNSPTLVHCSDGHGRVGMIVGCYLARHANASGKEALEALKQLRAFDPHLAEHKSPSNIVQERIVTRWKEGA